MQEPRHLGEREQIEIRQPVHKFIAESSKLPVDNPLSVFLLPIPV
jgi:hypothetical protein